MLRWRLLLGTLIITVIAGLCWADHVAPVPGIVLFPMLAALVWLACGEVLYLVEAGGMRPLHWVVYFGNMLIITCSWGACLWREFSKTMAVYEATEMGATEKGWQWSATASVWTLLALSAAILVAFVAEMRRYERPGGVTVNVAAAIFSFTYLGFLLSFVVQLRMAWGIGALASMVIVVKMGDIGAYSVGRLIGRNKMAPGLSPGKTIEGALGAMVFSAASAWATFQWLVPLFHDGPPDQGPWWRGIAWITFGLAVGIAGMAGDLAESLIKRDVKQKDSSSWLPGFGGVLDIFDSMLLAAPVAYSFWAFELVGH